MVDKAQFINVKINVDGKVHNVKVEKGVTFNSCFAMDNNKIVKYNREYYHWDAEDEKKEEESYRSYGTRIRPEYSSEIKMSKDEFTVFKNFADNKKESGNEIILSKKDVEIAESLFRGGEFTKDILKNLDGYASKNNQELNTDENGGVYIHAHVDDEYMTYSNKDIYFDKIREFAAKSANGEVKTMCHGDIGVAGYKYTDKDGKRHYVWTTGGDGQELTGQETIEYDKDGKKYSEWHVNGKLDTQNVKYTENGAEIEENYKNGVLQSSSKKYTKGNSTYEEVYKDGKYSKYVSYTNSKGIEVTEKRDYHTDKLLAKSYTDGNYTEEFYKNGKISLKKVYFGARATDDYVYENGKLLYKDVHFRGRYDAQGKMETCGGSFGHNRFNVKGCATMELSEKAKEYSEKFQSMSAKDIAKTIKSQIDGPSFNSKTIAMIEAIPEDKIIAVFKEYKNTKGIVGNKATLFTDLKNEWNLDNDDLTRVARRTFAKYLRVLKEKDFTEQDMSCASSMATEYAYKHLDVVEKQILK